MAGYSRWEDAMVSQTRMLDSLGAKSVKKYLTKMQASMDGQTHPQYRKPYGFYETMQKLTLQRADPVYVSKEVVEVVDYARTSFDPEAVKITDPFTQDGFCLLPEAIHIKDSSAGVVPTIPVRAIGWCTVIGDTPDEGCFWISYYSHVDDDVACGRMTADQGAIVSRTLGPLGLVHMFQWSFGETPWNMSDEEAKELRCPECHNLVTNLHGMGNQGGRNVCSMKGRVTEEQAEWIYMDDARLRQREQVTLIQTLWRIGQQVFKTPERAPRGLWRDANRKGIESKDVTVIKLRRHADGKEHEPTGREVGVQFIVRGYWRRQQCRDGVRQVWVSPHLKGPEDAPFKATKRVFEFVR